MNLLLKELKKDSSYYVVPMYYYKVFLKGNNYSKDKLYWYLSDNKKKLLLTEVEVNNTNKCLSIEQNEQFNIKFKELIA